MLALATLARLAFVAHALSDLPSSGHGGLGNNARRFHEIARIDGTPYRDAAVEMPPVAVALIEALDGDTAADLADRLTIAMAIAEVGCAFAIRAGWGPRAASRYWLLGTPLAYHAYLRLDLASVLLALVALLLVRRGRWAMGALALAAGVFTKVWPVALVPSLTARGRRRALAATATVLAAGGIAWVAWVGIQGPIQVATFRGATGWEFQTPAGLFLWKVRGLPLRFESGALRVGEVATLARMALPLLWMGIVAWVAVRTRRRPTLADGPGAVASVGTLLLTSTLFSDAYLTWLVPWAAITEDDRTWVWTAVAAWAQAGAVALAGSRLPDDASVVAGLLVVRAVAVAVVTAAALVVVARGSSGGTEVA